MSSKILALSISSVPGCLEGTSGKETRRARFLERPSRGFFRSGLPQVMDRLILKLGSQGMISETLHLLSQSVSVNPFYRGYN